MMVNQLNNNMPPWQTTVPSQMPWLDPYAVGGPIPFSQASHNQDNISLSPSVVPIISGTDLPIHHPLDPPHVSIPPTSNITQISPNVAPTQIGTMPGNPFEPQPVAGHQWAGVNAQSIVGGLNQPVQSGAIFTPLDAHFASSSLTQLPRSQQVSPSCSSDYTRPEYQKKRSSVEMEDEQTAREAPPTKQQLSESKLFKRFGTLQLDGERLVGPGEQEETDSDSSDDSVGKGGSDQDRKDFNRYVYLLFRDKKSNNLFNDATSHAMDRLIRDERDKLSKAVILWSPPLKDSLNQCDSSDDDDFRYNDHRDFLKKPIEDDEASIIITEVEDDVPIADACQNDGEDVMQD